MVSLEKFMDQIDTFERREKLCPCSGLLAMYGFLDGIPWWNRFLLRFQIRIRFKGIQRAGYDSTFWMYRNLRSRYGDCMVRPEDVDDPTVQIFP
jgi:hypothetical protein